MKIKKKGMEYFVLNLLKYYNFFDIFGVKKNGKSFCYYTYL